MKVVSVPVREDNYSYLLVDELSNKAAAVDPYDVPKIKAAADTLGVQIVAALTTHHHSDHSGGNERFALTYPDVPIYGGSQKVPALTVLVKDKDEFTVGDDIHVKCLATPCHTQDSICYHVTDATTHPGGVFTGDTLFIAGCGRFFEGTGSEMHAALTYLGTLPDETVVYDGHEYTNGNVAFAQSIDPENKGLEQLKDIINEHESAAGRTTIGDEKKWNLFMRLDSEAVRNATTNLSEPGKVMDILREKKNNYRA